MKDFPIQENDFKCFTCQGPAQDCRHYNNLFRDMLRAYNIEDPDNDITGIDLKTDGIEVTDKYEEENA